MGAGKSTMARDLADAPETVLISEDEWLSAIFPEEINSFDDYLKYSSRLKPLLNSHVNNLLNSGVSVVMDFPANTKTQRQWFKDIVSDNNIPYKLMHLDVDDQLCLEQIEKRRKSHPERARFDTEEIFYQVTEHFQPPLMEEGFNIEVVTGATISSD